MHQYALHQAETFADALDLNAVKDVLDLGGGSGAYAITFCRREPGLKGVVLDHPDVSKLCQEYVEAAGLTGQIEVRAGDMLVDAYGGPYDMIWLSNVVHAYGPDEIKHVFSKCHAHLKPGGRFVLRDFMLDDDKTTPAFGAIFALNMLVNTQHGSSYSRREYTQWLENAGFSEVQHLTVEGAGNTELLIAR